jgi:SAM-dependent methyltransferase
MGGTSLAFRRRSRDPLFTERVFVGDGIDIGAGPDPLGPCPEFPLLRRMRAWDLVDGDAVVMRDLDNESFDLVYSSHCLEHIRESVLAVERWWQLVKPGGHLVIVVPDFRTYERGVWPSLRNPGHEDHYDAASLFSYGTFLNGVLVRFETLDFGFDGGSALDQTATGTCECGLEIIVRKEAP